MSILGVFALSTAIGVVMMLVREEGMGEGGWSVAYAAGVWQTRTGRAGVIWLCLAKPSDPNRYKHPPIYLLDPSESSCYPHFILPLMSPLREHPVDYVLRDPSSWATIFSQSELIPQLFGC